MRKKLEKIKMRSLPILREYNVVRAGIFGSYARGKEKRNSDIDMLVEFGDRKSLFDLVGLEIELKKLLKKNVDLLTYKSINPFLREGILKEEIRIL